MPKGKGKRTARAKSSNDANAIQAPAAPPSWPVFRPPLPLSDIRPEPLLDSRVLLIRNFWPKSLCRDYVSFLRCLPLTTTPGKPKRGDAVRVNDRFQVQDQRFANRLWLETGLKQVLMSEEWKGLWGGDVAGLSPNIRIYRYSAGQFFDAHYDDSNIITSGFDQGTPVSTKTTWTLLLYLTSEADGCRGGETVFFPNDRKVAKEEVAIPPETGMVLLHKHGDDCMMHEGREVTAGEKWVVRSDLIPNQASRLESELMLETEALGAWCKWLMVSLFNYAILGWQGAYYLEMSRLPARRKGAPPRKETSELSAAQSLENIIT